VLCFLKSSKDNFYRLLVRFTEEKGMPISYEWYPRGEKTAIPFTPFFFIDLGIVVVATKPFK